MEDRPAAIPVLSKKCAGRAPANRVHRAADRAVRPARGGEGLQPARPAAEQLRPLRAVRCKYQVQRVRSGAGEELRVRGRVQQQNWPPVVQAERDPGREQGRVPRGARQDAARGQPERQADDCSRGGAMPGAGAAAADEGQEHK